MYYNVCFFITFKFSFFLSLSQYFPELMLNYNAIPTPTDRGKHFGAMSFLSNGVMAPRI